MNTYKVDMINLTEAALVKPKRGRKSKKDIEAAAAAAAAANQLQDNGSINIDIEEKLVASDVASNLNEHILSNEENIDADADEVNFLINVNADENAVIKPVAKKRGRKPKGGKIIQQVVPIVNVKEEKPNVILHLKCSIRDLHSQNGFDYNLEPFHFSNNKDLTYNVLEGGSELPMYNVKPPPIFNESTSIVRNNAIEEANNYESDNEKEIENKIVWKKLKQLEHSLHINNIGDKKSACFWCTYEFDNPTIYIPKHFIKDSYQVYGCFCSPECAVAHLMEEHIDSSTKFERYHLLNHIYAKVYDYKKNIKPAPNVYYMLEKYYGNLSIQEYRSLLRNERFFLIVDKPLTRILPELHEDNEDHIINNKIIPSSNLNIKKKLQRKPQSKNNILNEKFGMHCANIEQ